MLKRDVVVRWFTERGLGLSGKVVCVAKAGQTINEAIKRDLDWTKIMTHGAAEYDRYVVRVKGPLGWEFYALKVEGFEERHALAKPDWSKACWCGESPVAPETGCCGLHTFGDEVTAGGEW